MMANFLLLQVQTGETGTAEVTPPTGTVPCHLCTAASGGSFGGLQLCQKNEGEVGGSGGTNLLGTPWPEESQ